MGTSTRDEGRGLRIARELLDDMLAHCQSRYPKEACGMLGGQAGVVQQVYPMTNMEDSPIGYSMDPPEQLRVERLLRERHQQTIAIYHSHTASEAYPSSVDIGLAISPDVSYVLVSLKDRAQPIVRSYRISGTTVTEEPVRIGESPPAPRRIGAG